MPLGEKLRRLADDELQRSASRDAARARLAGLNHMTRLLDFLTRTLEEYEEASAAFVDNIRRQDELGDAEVVESRLFDEGGRLAVVVHCRIETFCALARLLLQRALQALDEYFGPSGPPDAAGVKLSVLTEELATERDFHVKLGHGPPVMIASLWAASGDAGMTPANAFASRDAPTVTLPDLLDRLIDCVEQIVDDIHEHRSG